MAVLRNTLLPKPLKPPKACLLQEQYQFLDPSTPPSSLAQQDQKLAQSKAFQQLLGVVRDGGQGVSQHNSLTPQDSSSTWII